MINKSFGGLIFMQGFPVFVVNVGKFPVFAVKVGKVTFSRVSGDK